MEKRPKLALIRFIFIPESQSIVSCLSSQAYIVLYLARWFPPIELAGVDNKAGVDMAADGDSGDAGDADDAA